MDIYSFVNSRDVRDYLRGIAYPFSSLEAAWVVWQSRRPLREKHESWRHIIDTMPDCPIKERHVARPWESLHEYLRKLIALEQKQISDFCRNTGNVYTYELRMPGQEDYTPGGKVFRDFDGCLQELQQKQALEARYLVHKMGHENSNEIWTVWLDENLEIWRIIGLLPKDALFLKFNFDGLWFEFPVPFRKGDILHPFCDDFYPCPDDTFVFDTIPPKEENEELWRWSGSCEDVLAWGYFHDSEDEQIRYECKPRYMDLEYFRGELTGGKRVLKPLSSFLKGEIDISLYTRAYRTILAEEQAKRSYPKDITEKGLSLAGLR